MKKLLPLILFIGFCSSLTGIAHADYYSWSVDRMCREYANNGRAKDVVADFHCGADTYNWATDNMCHVFAGSGRPKETVADSHCGTDTYNWSQDNMCRLYAGNGRAKEVARIIIAARIPITGARMVFAARTQEVAAPRTSYRTPIAALTTQPGPPTSIAISLPEAAEIRANSPTAAAVPLHSKKSISIKLWQV